MALYAARQSHSGYQYGPDTVWQKEFEEMFPFEETEDQLSAIEAAKHDMESRKIMDRLVCGDVGYGKTEIAIRAAFKAVQESKQVVYLVPTTILAQQHYNTFIQRMKDFPVRVDLLCRFKTPTEQKKTITDLQKGLVDIVIGTHRLLSKDVKYKDLGKGITAVTGIIDNRIVGERNVFGSSFGIGSIDTSLQQSSFLVPDIVFYRDISDICGYQ